MERNKEKRLGKSREEDYRSMWRNCGLSGTVSQKCEDSLFWVVSVVSKWNPCIFTACGSASFFKQSRCREIKRGKRNGENTGSR